MNKVILAIAIALMPMFAFADETIVLLHGQACWSTKPERTIKDADGNFLICRNGKFMFAKEARRIKEIELRPCLDANGSNTRPDGSLYSCRLGKDGTLYIE